MPRIIDVRRRPLPTTLARLAAAVASLALAAAAIAENADDWNYQGFDTGAWAWTMQAPTRSPIAQRDVERYAEWLDLSPDQRAAVEDLTAALVERCLAAWVRFAERRQDAQQQAMVENDWQSMQTRAGELAAEHADQRDRHIDTFFQDLRLFLSPDQEAAWPRVERHRRRAETLTAYASADGEGLDLIAVVDALALDPADRQPLDPALRDYEVRLDALLETRNRRAEALGEKAADFETTKQSMYAGWGKDGEVDDKKMQEIQDFQAEQHDRQRDLVADALHVHDAGQRIAALNHEYIDTLTPLIPDHAREDWRASLDAPVRSLYDWAKGYQQNRAGRVIDMMRDIEQHVSMIEYQTRAWAGDDSPFNEWAVFARTVEPLTPDQRDQLDRIREDLEREIDRLTPEDERPDDPRGSFIRVPTPRGALTIARAGEDHQHLYNPWQGDQSEEAKERRRAIMQANIDALERVRRVLTLKQRALAAQMF